MSRLGCSTCLRSLGRQLRALCEYDGEEPGHARLHRMCEERELELAARQARAKQMAVEEQRCAREWQAELRALEQQRAGMADQELELDCLSHYACSGVLLSFASSAKTSMDAQDERAGAKLSVISGVPHQDPSIDAEYRCSDAQPQPTGLVEQWLNHYFGTHTCTHTLASAQSSCFSFGELPTAACPQLVESLAHTLVRSADDADAAASEARGTTRVRSNSLSAELERIFQKYAADEALDGATVVADAEGPAGGMIQGLSRETEVVVRAFRARAAHHRAVGRRLTTLLPCLAEDAASTRLVAALAVLDLGQCETLPTAGSMARDFRASLRTLSTADACWALCSEKRRLILDNMLPSVLAEGRWFWPEARRAGLGWWLSGAGVELVDALVTKLVQSIVSRLRIYISTEQPLPGSDSGTEKALRRLADEALFWYVLSGATPSRLRALLKTGILSGEPALARLLEHPRCGEAHFVRKNAFRLLQLHRFHLAAGLFMLCGSHEEAARVVAGHLRDLQLMLVLTRRCPEVAAPLLRDHLAESPFAERDPWLRLLLAWHAGDHEAALCSMSETVATPLPESEGEAPLPLFDGVLRLSTCHDGLREVRQLLQGSSVKS